MSSKSTVFVVWKACQRRVDAFKSDLQTIPVYLHYDWEERSRVHKAISYVLKSLRMVAILGRVKPDVFYVQAPPTIALYVAFLYSRLAHARYVVDAHNSMIYGSFWCRMPFWRLVLRKALLVLVHNEFVANVALRERIPCAVLMDRPPEVRPETYQCPQSVTDNRPRPWVVVPCSYDADEPLAELRQATAMLPEVTFFMTWYREKLPPAFARNVGPNVVFTGFLPQSQFDALLAHADLILVLTTRDGTQPSGASEALAFGKALVISDLQIIRSLFPAGAVYIDNQASAIAKGIRTGLSQKEQLETEMKLFLTEKMSRWRRQFAELSRVLSGVSQEIG